MKLEIHPSCSPYLIFQFLRHKKHTAVITCDIEAGKCLEFHNCFLQGISCYDCTRVWIANLRIQVAELGQVDLQQTKNARELINKLKPIL
jgi:hypothetical protein